MLGTFVILYREVRAPSIEDLHLIENPGHIAGIAIERQLNAEKLRHERDRLRLLLEITNSMTSKLDFRRLIEALSTDLLSVTRCDFCALLLPEADRKQMRITVLWNIRVLDDSGRSSHYIWRDPEHILIYTAHPSGAERFYLVNERTGTYEPVPGMEKNRHVTCSAFRSGVCFIRAASNRSNYRHAVGHECISGTFCAAPLRSGTRI